MRLQAACLLLASFSASSWAILTDEAYQIDYHHALLGTPQAHATFFHKPTSSSSASLLYTLSESSIIGAVNPKDGLIVWRQNVSDYSVGTSSGGLLQASEGEDAVISALGRDVLAWGASDGRLLWKNRFPEGPIVDLKPVDQAAAGAHALRDSILLSGERNGIVRRLDGMLGSVKWEFRDDSDDIPFRISTSSSTFYYISLQVVSQKGYRIKVTGLDPQTGRQTSQYTLNSENDISSLDSVIFASGNSMFSVIAWLDQESKNLKINAIGSKTIHSIVVKNQSGEAIQDVKIHASNIAPHFLVSYNTLSKSWAEIYHMNEKMSTVSEYHRLPLLNSKSIFAQCAIGDKSYFPRITTSTIDLFMSASKEVLGAWRIKEISGEPQHAAAEVVARGAGFAIRFAQVDESGDWILIRNGELEWRRPESLTDTIVAAWADMNGGEALAQELEFEGHQDVLSAYIHRVKRHAKGLQENFLPWLKDLPDRIVSSFLSNEGTDLSQFGFGKYVVLATRKGRVLALDSGHHGAILWNTKVADDTTTWGAKSIHTNHGIATVFVNDGSTVKLNITSGQIVERSKATKAYASLILVPDTKSPIPVMVDSNGVPRDMPSLLGDNKFLVTISEDGKLFGWSSIDLKVPAWEFVAPKGQKVVHVTTRPAHDPVASIGKVLGDRSVFYKYLNPNLALITAITSSSVTFYLLDGISGRVIYTATQDGVDTSQPIASVISENWFAYSYWTDVTDNSDAKGSRLVISELYESSIPNDRGALGDAANYSSLHSSTAALRPHAISQAYVIPELISSMAVTDTRQGITIRQLLCTLPASNAIVGIPKFILDPRRPVNRDPTSQEAEEGLMRYTPFLEFDPKWYLNHAREVLGIERIESSPTLLESSTLIFAYGFDVFGTRLAPSQPFDMLGKGFSKIQLLITVLALAAGVVVLAPMVRLTCYTCFITLLLTAHQQARRKMVDLQWKT
ncbi:hypothetical protein LOZ12_005281 [Ophidiomyces ophidiicola]|uniref:Uncharacterized protein n=1 Tax=Ophidiomyces ophidiicola TaxID=1387563 RepID=A0ACB8UQQ9_9EURO|nr:hypothetical protein LOZ62_002218 [Ophidiomyces ophidiicola]KAI1967975.1 hypothetical protein LOZ56_005253 [Ophidiomyces ophidiicola]KAI2009689.1 hypothetical protein LOZ50_001423 [Ophidiomyces ophidiicola]KAI2023061.1 hypothetical protein LOZ45_004144 [Ophidiomyces ophidiicola]KAI2033713.1 hypothetical protein LOZ47_005324 [Ophidiomyces ophidiicola]